MDNFSGHFFLASFVICCICVMANSESPISCIGLFMADPDDSTKYYKCVGSQPIQMSCPSGSVWNAKINACNAKLDAQCKQKYKNMNQMAN